MNSKIGIVDTYFVMTNKQNYNIIVYRNIILPIELNPLKGIYTMEFIYVSNKKIKIILSKEEMEAYSIKPNDFDYEKTSSKHALWSLMDQVEKETGFKTDKSKLLVHLFSSKDGGCELFVSKIQNDLLPSYFRPSNKSEFYASEIYCISLTYDNLYNLCKRISTDKFKYITSLFCDGEKYILVFIDTDDKNISHSNETVNIFPHYISEYGNVIKFEINMLTYFEEHYLKIADKNAVEIISKL